MSVTIAAPIDTSPPPLGEGQLWDPDAMGAVVFPEPLGKRSLAYDATTVDNMWARAVAEVDWLRNMLGDYHVKVAELEAAGRQEQQRAAAQQAQSMRDAARSEAVQIVHQAREQAAREVGMAHLKAQGLLADALDRIAAAERATAGPPELDDLPVYTQNVADSLTARTEVAMDNVRTVLAEATALEQAAARARQTLTPMLSPPTPEPATVRSTWSPGPEVVTDVVVMGGGISPHGSRHLRPSATARVEFADLGPDPAANDLRYGDNRSPSVGDTSVADRARRAAEADAGPDAVVISSDHPEHGLTTGDLVDEADVPAGVVFHARPAPPEYRPPLAEQDDSDVVSIKLEVDDPDEDDDWDYDDEYEPEDADPQPETTDDGPAGDPAGAPLFDADFSRPPEDDPDAADDRDPPEGDRDV